MQSFLEDELNFLSWQSCVEFSENICGGASMQELVVFVVALASGLSLFSGHSAAGEMQKAVRQGEIDALRSAIS